MAITPTTPDVPAEARPAAARQRQAALEWNNTDAPFPAVPVHRLIERQVRRTPDRVAVVFDGARLTYRELNRRANRLARRLREHGVGRDVLVGVHCDRSLEMVVALLAVLKAGGAYLPLQPDLPPERLALMLADARPAVVVGQPIDLARRPPLLDIDADRPGTAEDTDLDVEPRGDDLVYVIYTSGSTGKPKGAMNTQLALTNRLDWAQRQFRLDADDALLQKTPFGFDVSVWEFFWPLLAGARLVLARPGAHRDPDQLADLIAAERITTVHFVPSMLRVFLETPALAPRCRSLRRVLCSGEALTVHLQRRFTELLDAELHNLYGPAETAIEVTHWPCASGTGQPGTAQPVVPIGRPISNCRVYLLDGAGRPVPAGVAGEIWLGGVSVGRGYLNQPELTAQRFVDDRFGPPGGRMYRTGDLARRRPDGVLEFLGRIDDQIKIRGHRVEPREIELVLCGHPAVQDAAVTVSPGPDGPQLAGFVVPRADVALPLRRLLELQRSGAAAGRARHRLADGTTVFGVNAAETTFLYEEIFGRQEYLRHGIGLPERPCVFDVGANIGLFALYVGRIRPDAVVYGFEPIPAVFDLLRLNSRLSPATIHALDYGLADQPGEAAFTYYPHLSILSGQYADDAEDRRAVEAHVRSRWRSQVSGQETRDMLDAVLAGERVRCRLRTVSEAIREHRVARVDLLKIDVERGELAVLAGIEPGDWPKIGQVVVEVQDTGGRLRQVTDLLRRHGLRVAVDRQEKLPGADLYYVYASRYEPFESPSTMEPAWSDPDTFVARLREFAAARLPGPMVPAALMPLSELPVLPSGKTDYRTLRATAMGPSRPPTAVPAGTQTERLLLPLWEDLLGRRGIGVTDSLFDLGGTSLTAARIAARIRATTGHRVPVSTVLRNPTVAALAASLGPVDG
jgi:amino acid adenylation domain-containing protein/FkbM family methyltransferase